MIRPAESVEIIRMKFSVVIPAHNEEVYIGKCLDSIERAAAAYPGQVEIIVVLNRCTDSTEQIAREHGARIVIDDSRNLAMIRNTGAVSATGEILVTIDADSWMTENMFSEIERALHSGRYIGGAVPIQPERMSIGIALSLFFLKGIIYLAGLGGGLYWCYRRDFEAIGGFNGKLLVAEDLDFAKRLKILGRTRSQKFINLRRAYITTSCRKFDHFGDWLFLRMILFHGRELRAVLRGTNTELPNRYFYDFEHPRKEPRQ